MRRVWFFVLLLSGCHATLPQPRTDAPLRFTAEVVRLEIEAGFWGLRTADGRRFDPGGLPAGFREPGLRVYVEGDRVKGGISVRMWGQPIRIRFIERLDRLSGDPMRVTGAVSPGYR